MSDDNNDELRATKLLGWANDPRLSHRQMTTSAQFYNAECRKKVCLRSARLALQYRMDDPVVFEIDDVLRIFPSRDGWIADGSLA